MEEEIFGTFGDDILTGTSADELITGFSGNDTIDGGAGNDTAIYYGAHADYIITQNADGSWTLTDTELAADNQGQDKLINIEQITFTRTGTFTQAELLALQTTEDQTITGTANPEDISGSLGNDTLSGGDGADSLYGGPGDDRLNSGRGDDFINGGTGEDTLVLEGSFADYTITYNSEVSVNIRDTRTGSLSQGNDQVENVEQVVFSSGETISIAAWLQGSIPLNLINDIAGQTQYITGTALQDAFVIDGNSTDYGWGQTGDGNGIVVWNGADFDVLFEVEQINFNDGSVTQQPDGTFTFDPIDTGDNGETNLINDIATQNQTINGSNGQDAFIIDGISTDYGWGQTGDGQGIVVWNGPAFDILNNVEEIRFNNGTLTMAEDGTFSFTPTGTPETGFNLIADSAENEFITGLDRPDIFVIDGASTDYGWGQTGDGQGIVVWNGPAFDILNNVEQLQFSDGTVSQLADDTFIFASTAEILNLTGTNADETLSGGNANDILNGQGGNDTLSGGAGLDIFVAGQNSGNDIILDFTDGEDLIDLTALSGTINSFDDLTITQNGANAVISFDNNSFTLNGVQTDTLTFNDFII